MLALCSIPARAIADAGADARKEAKRHYDAGETHFRLGELDQAISEWRQSFELSRVPLLLYDIAQAYRQKGDSKQALFFYQQYLSVAPTGENHDVAEKRIEELKQAIAAEQKAQTAPPQDPASPPQMMEQPTSSPPPPGADLRAATTPRRPWYKNAPGMALAGGGLAVAIVGAGLVGAGFRNFDDARTATTLPEQQRLQRDSDTFKTAGWVTFGIGSAAMLTGVIILAARR
jgi:iron complex outermembrane receptor protein